jgi:hypothetical protein
LSVSVTLIKTLRRQAAHITVGLRGNGSFMEPA